MKKICCLFSVTLFCLFLSIPATAMEYHVNHMNYSNIEPQYIGISSFFASLSIDQKGNATASSRVIASNSSYQISLLVELQKYNSNHNKWNTIKSWNGRGTGFIGASISEIYSVDHGTFRTKATAIIYNSLGKFVDEAEVYSPSKTY